MGEDNRAVPFGGVSCMKTGKWGWQGGAQGRPPWEWPSLQRPGGPGGGASEEGALGAEGPACAKAHER